MEKEIEQTLQEMRRQSRAEEDANASRTGERIIEFYLICLPNLAFQTQNQNLLK